MNKAAIGHTQPRRAFVMLALVSWVLTSAQAIEMAFYPSYRTIYLFILAGVAVLGLFGCIAWAREWSYWRRALIAAAAIYLLVFVLVFALRFVVVFIGPHFEHDSLFDALRMPFRIIYAVSMRHLADGALISFCSLIFYEWLMPLLQIVVLAGLVWPPTTGSRGDAPQAARA